MEKYTFEDYAEIIDRLRAEDGCPWDRKQTHESLKPGMLDETAEAMAAVDVLRMTGDASNLCEELGDMLLHVMLQSQIAKEEGYFDIYDVVQAAAEKMIRRHPHVFGTAKEPDWEGIKRAEKALIPPEVEAAKEQALRIVQEEILDAAKKWRQ